MSGRIMEDLHIVCYTAHRNMFAVKTNAMLSQDSFTVGLASLSTSVSTRMEVTVREKNAI